MRVLLFFAAAIGVLVCAPEFAQSKTTWIDNIFEERRNDGSGTVGISGCGWDVQAEYEYGPGGPSTAQRVKLGFAEWLIVGRRLSVEIDGVMHDLGPFEKLLAYDFRGTRSCRALALYTSVYVSRDIFLRIATAGSITFYADNKPLEVDDLPLLSSLAKRLTAPRRALKRPSK